jgi:hypothetical protein
MDTQNKHHERAYKEKTDKDYNRGGVSQGTLGQS